MKRSVSSWFFVGLLTTGLLLSARIPAQPGEIPPIAFIEIYGLRTLPEQSVRALLPFKEGDIPNPEQAESLEQEISNALGVYDVEIDGVCCVASGLIIYVGVQEQPDPGLRLRDPPLGKVTLPAEMVASVERFEVAIVEAVNTGEAGDDFSEGHSLMEYPSARAIQTTFIKYAAEHGELLRKALYESADPLQRATAAMVLAYSADKASVAEDLTWAASDPDPEVRNSAARALGGIASYSNAHPELGITIPPDPFVDMLNSPVFGDRNDALMIIMGLTESRDPELLKRLSEQSFPSLIEMCRWKNWGHANPACLILQRVVGLPDNSDPSSREPTIEKVLEADPRRRPVQRQW